MPDAFIVEVDWDNNGAWTGTGEDVTSRVLSRAGVATSRGSNLGRGLLLPAAGHATALLDNRSGDYTLSNGASPLVGLLKPGRPVRIRRGPATPYNVWRGYLAGLPQSPDRANSSVGIPAEGIFSRLRRKGLSSAVYIDTPVDTCMRAVLAALGLDSTTYRDFDVAVTSLTSWWFSSNDDLLDTLVKLWLSEGPGARLYEDGQGRIAFRNRHAWFTDSRSATSQVTFNATGAEPRFMAPLDYVDPWQTIVNSVSMTHVDRTLGAVGVVWTHGTTVEILAGETKPIPVLAAVPFYDAIQPVSGTDYTATGGTLASITLDRLSGIQCLLTIVGHASLPTTITGLQVRAQSLPITRTSEVRSTVDAAASIDDYGEQPYQIDAYPEIDELEQQDWANAMVTQNKDIRSMVTFTVVSGDATRLANQMGREIGDRITLGAYGDYFIEHIAHEITHAGGFIRTRFGCRQCPSTNFFVLDVSTLGSSYVLAY